MPTYKLYYFNGRARAEVIRLLFVAAGVDFEDVRLNFEEWPALKPTMPLGQMPVLEIDGEKMTQCNAIARYLAREFGFAGKTSLDQYKVDEIASAVYDFVTDEGKVIFTPEDKKDDAYKKLLEVDVPKHARFLEDRLISNGGGDGFFVGSELTMADLIVYPVWYFCLKKDPDMLSKYPKLAAHLERVETLPKIAEWLKTRGETDI